MESKLGEEMSDTKFILSQSAGAQEHRLKSGEVVDINNIPGVKKLQLIESGQMTIDNFMVPPNCPGKVLKKLQDEHRDSFLDSMKKGKEYHEKENTKNKVAKDKTNVKIETKEKEEGEIKNGTVVKYNKHQTKVIAFRTNRKGEPQYRVKNAQGSKEWVSPDKITVVSME